MKTIFGFIRLLRPLNLLIIAFTMYAMRWGIIYTMAKSLDETASLVCCEWVFLLATLVMVLLAAAGNIINDYFDLRVDRINKPERVVVGKTVKRRVAMAAHHFCNALATVLGIFLAYSFKSWLMALLPIFMGAMLWFYSVQFKKQAWIGNFIVALMVGIVPLWAGLFEIASLKAVFDLQGKNGELFSSISWSWIFAYSIFAFWLTLIRESLKDLEDLKGDKKVGFKTLPIVWGILGVKRYLHGLFLVFYAALGLGLYYYRAFLEEAELSLAFWIMLVLGILFPSVFAWYKMGSAVHKAHYTAASRGLKITMAGGICIAVLMPFWW